MKIDKKQWKWTREPKAFSIENDRIEIITNPHTDLWQRTYYHFRNDNAPVLQITTDEIQFGIYACSPEESSFKAIFTNMEITECKWLAHDGQAPDEDIQ